MRDIPRGGDFADNVARVQSQHLLARVKPSVTTDTDAVVFRLDTVTV